MQTLKEVRSYFEKDLYAAKEGITIEEIDDGRALCRVKIQDSHKNAAGIVHGGLIYTLADFTFAVAANTRHPGTVTLSGTIHYFSAPKGEWLTAEARCLHDGKTTCLYEVILKDEQNLKVAMTTYTGYKKKLS